MLNESYKKLRSNNNNFFKIQEEKTNEYYIPSNGLCSSKCLLNCYPNLKDEIIEKTIKYQTSYSTKGISRIIINKVIKKLNLRIKLVKENEPK